MTQQGGRILVCVPALLLPCCVALHKLRPLSEPHLLLSIKRSSWTGNSQNLECETLGLCKAEHDSDSLTELALEASEELW